MTMLSDIDEEGINRNLHVRYDRDQIYVSFSRIPLCEAGAKLMKSRAWWAEALAGGSHEPRQEEIDAINFHAHNRVAFARTYKTTRGCYYVYNMIYNIGCVCVNKTTHVGRRNRA